VNSTEFDPITKADRAPTPRRPGLAQDGPSTGPVGQDELDVLTGFAAWLGRQDIPQWRRGEYYHHVARYLDWRADQQTSRPSASKFALSLGGHRKDGRRVRASFALLGRYLLAASYRRTGATNPLW
jgi:hypothetical protein